MTEPSISHRQEETLTHLVLRRFFKHRLAAIALVVLGLMVLAALAASLGRYSSTDQNPANQFEPPNLQHWFGTDNLGRDILSRVIMGARISLWVGIMTVGLAMLIGVPAGVHRRLPSRC